MSISAHRPLVTIALPVFNAGDHLRDCLKSILEQTFTDWELIAIDDGSTDASYKILSSITHPRVRVLKNARNLGPSETRNRIINQANGAIIALQDADDFMAPERLAVQVGRLLDDDSVDLVGCYMNLVNDTKKLSPPLGTPREKFSVLGLLFRPAAPNHATLVARKSWFLRNPYPTDLRRGEDKLMIVNAVKNEDFAYTVVNSPLYFYRSRGSKAPQKRLIAYRAERSHLIKLLNGFPLKFAYFNWSLFKTIVVAISHVRKVSLIFFKYNKGEHFPSD